MIIPDPIPELLAGWFGDPWPTLLVLWLVGFVVAMLWSPLLIGPLRNMARQRIDQSTRPTLFKLHGSKQGTPSMGGLLFLINLLVLALLLLRPFSAQVVVLLVGLILIGLVGLVDDLLTSRSTRYSGLTVWHKSLLQLVVAGVVTFQVIGQDLLVGLHVPMVGHWDVGPWLLAPVILLTLVSSMNAVNLTDGLDGLAGGVSLFGILTFMIIAAVQAQWGLAAVLAILAGSLVAFLWFNIFPARFFMGDVGALSLGFALGMSSVLTNQLFLLPIIAVVSVLETLSVILQVSWRKLFQKKFFDIAPLHHHFEHKGWPETKVSQRFWLLGLMSGVVSLVIFFLDRSLLGGG